jgi:lysophospholipase L1-like esterase
VTVIGDSVLTAVSWDGEPTAILRDGLDVHLEIGICRRLTGTSCPSGGAPTSTLVDVARTLGAKLGPTVLVEVGYNDDAPTFAQGVDEAIATLLAGGVTRILWLNLREAQPHYSGMNAVLVAAARAHPELSIIDWNGHSRGHDSWFQPDGVHLTYDGAVAIATLMHDALAEALLRPLVLAPVTLPVGRVGHPYSARLRTPGGTPPYSWRLLSGPLPRGLRLLADGRILGTPRSRMRLQLVLRATDATWRTGTLRTTLVVVSA